MPEDTSSSPQPDTICLGSGPSQPQSDFVGLRVMHEPEEERDMNDLRVRFLERHRKRLYDPIDIVPPPTKRVCPERVEEDPTAEVPPSTMSHPDKAGPSAATTTQPDVARLNAVAVVQPDVVAPNNVPSAEEARGTEGGPDAAIDEKASDEKSSPAAAVPSSWEKMMEMLKGVSCFTDAKAPSTKMFDSFLLTKRVSMNMGCDPPTFVKARLPFSTPESAVSYIQHL